MSNPWCPCEVQMSNNAPENKAVSFECNGQTPSARAWGKESTVCWPYQKAMTDRGGLATPAHTSRFRPRDSPSLLSSPFPSWCQLCPHELDCLSQWQQTALTFTTGERGISLPWFFVFVAQLPVTLCDPMNCTMPGFPVLHSLPEFAQLMSIESVMPSNHLILWHPLLLLPSIVPSIRVFSNELALHIRWPKYWSFSFSISPSNKYSEFISFRIDWLDLLSVQGTLKSLLQHYSLKTSILLHSNFFMVQLSHLYMTPGKTIALTLWTFVGKVMSLLFNTYLGSS